MILLLGCAWVGDQDMALRVDQDGDGFWSEDFGGYDCDDQDPKVHPGADEVCNGIDDDCRPANDAVERTWYVDADGDGFGSDAVLTCVSDTAGWSLEPGDCDDDHAQAFPGALEICADGLDNDCDGRVDCLGEEGWQSFGEAEIAILGSGDHRKLGFALVVADLDGDGAVDLLASEDTEDGYSVYRLDWASGTSNDGELLTEQGGRVLLAAELDGEPGAEVLSGGNTGTWTWTTGLVWEPEVERDGYLVGAADVDGDGLDEALGVLNAGNSNYPSFAVSADGVTVWNDPFRMDGASSGDVDGDGHTDLLLSGPVSGGQYGQARLFRDPLRDSVQASWLGEGEYDGLGETVSLADLDGDGFDEVILSAPGLTDGEDRGVALVWFGGPTPPVGAMRLDEADFGVYGSVDGSGSGGDMDADGAEELLVWNDWEGASVSLWQGPWSGWMAAPDMERALPDFQVYVAADVDGDGLGDLVVADYSDSSGGTSAGLIAVVFGP